MLEYKPDWEDAKSNYRAWWEREYFGRCAIAVYAPKKGVKLRRPPLPAKLEDRWLDLKYLAKLNEYRMKTTFYDGEAFPIWNPGYPGHDSHPVYLGCNCKLSEDTGWVDPIIDEGELTDYDYNQYKIDRDGETWKFFKDIRRLAVSEAKGKSIPGNGAFGGCGDTLAALRSSLKLLYDVIDCPDYVREFDCYLMKQWIDIHNESYAITHEGAEGSTCYFDIWSPGRFYGIHNDFSYMISSKMLEDIFMPALKMQTDYLDHAVYHVDGIMAFHHVDVLFGLSKIQAYQILPGAGKPSPLYYMDTLKKVQAAKRNLHISIPAGEVKDALETLSARGLFISTYCETEAEARDILRYAEKNSVDRG